MATTYTVKCIGPGPHDANCAADGTFGVSAEPVTTWRCTAAVCQPPAVLNTATIQQHIDTNMATVKQWIANNPNGAQLTNAQNLVLAKLLVGIGKILRGDVTDTTGT